MEAKEILMELFSNTQEGNIDSFLALEHPTFDIGEMVKEIHQQGFTKGEQEGHAAGYEEGEKDGQKTGYDNGWSRGHEAGRNDGYNEGFSRARNQFDR